MYALGQWVVCKKTEGKKQTESGLFLAPGTAAAEYVVVSVGSDVDLDLKANDKVLFRMTNALASGNYIMVHRDDMISVLAE